MKKLLLVWFLFLTLMSCQPPELKYGPVIVYNDNNIYISMYKVKNMFNKKEIYHYEKKIVFGIEYNLLSASDVILIVDKNNFIDNDFSYDRYIPLILYIDYNRYNGEIFISNKINNVNKLFIRQ